MPAFGSSLVSRATCASTSSWPAKRVRYAFSSGLRGMRAWCQPSMPNSPPLAPAALGAGARRAVDVPPPLDPPPVDPPTLALLATALRVGAGALAACASKPPSNSLALALSLGFGLGLGVRLVCLRMTVFLIVFLATAARVGAGVAE